MDNMVMRIAFGTCAFVLSQGRKENHQGAYTWFELGDLDEDGEGAKVFPAVNERNSKAKSGDRIFYAKESDFSKKPGSPIAYWVSERVLEGFEIGTMLGDFAEVKRGMTTSDNNRFLRYWYEVFREKIISQCWKP
jgi:hypothetical protein